MLHGHENSTHLFRTAWAPPKLQNWDADDSIRQTQDDTVGQKQLLRDQKNPFQICGVRMLLPNNLRKLSSAWRRVRKNGRKLWRRKRIAYHWRRMRKKLSSAWRGSDNSDSASAWTSAAARRHKMASAAGREFDSHWVCIPCIDRKEVNPRVILRTQDGHHGSQMRDCEVCQNQNYFVEVQTERHIAKHAVILWGNAMIRLSWMQVRWKTSSRVICHRHRDC